MRRRYPGSERRACLTARRAAMALSSDVLRMTVVLDKPGRLSRRQVGALDRGGMTIGVHTWDHDAELLCEPRRDF